MNPVPVAHVHPDAQGRGRGPALLDAAAADVARGEVSGFPGPNGAGKSSTMRMIACVSPRTAGPLQVLGTDPAADALLLR